MSWQWLVPNFQFLVTGQVSSNTKGVLLWNPFMVTHIDMVGSQITWAKKGKAWLEKKKEPPGKLAYDENVELFNLLWHRVIGVIWTPEVVFTNNFIKAKKNTANLNHQAKCYSHWTKWVPAIIYWSYFHNRLLSQIHLPISDYFWDQNSKEDRVRI